MYSSAKFTIFCALIVSSYATPIFEPIFASLADDSQWETNIVKREVVPEKNDVAVKQVSLQSLIGSLEHSLVRSAQSVSSITNSKNNVLPEVTPPTVEENHTQKKRHTEQTETTEANQKVTTSTEIPPKEKVLYLQRTEKVPLKDGSPAHILIDRVTVQDFNGDLPLILPFEVKHTKSVSATIQSGNPTEISITKTHTTSTSTLVGSSSTENPATTSSVTGSSTEHSTVAAAGSTSTTKANSESTNSSTEKPISTTVSADNKSSSSTITTAETTSTTTKTPIVKLKEAEQELKEAEQDLKEKVAEIEADPVILSSRV